jgi:rhodanese-related sulfurtransferase
MKSISPIQLHERQLRGEAISLLDVRTPAEHNEVHVPGVQLVPLDRLDPGQLASANGFAKDRSIYILCRSGNRARQAAEKLEKNGFAECHVVEGGTIAWIEAGLPVNRGPSRVISLERQVRIVAGFIVLSGVLLAHFVHPSFIFLSGFIGAGLIFAGITDWCGMGMLIARMPWNQRGGDAEPSNEGPR